MFKFFKEKLKSWLGKSKEKIEEKVEKETKEEKKPEEELKEKLEKIEKKAEKEIKKQKKKAAKEKKAEEEKEESLLEKKPREEEKEEAEKTEITEEEIEKLEETMKEAPGKELPMKFETGLQKYVPDSEILFEKKPWEETQLEEEIEPISREAPAFERIEEEKEKEKKPSIFKRLKERFSYKLSEEDFEEIFENLEMLLLENNVALEAVESIKKQLKSELLGKDIKKADLEQEIKKALKKAIENLLIEPDDILETVKLKKPFVIVFFGINGTGKTTTIAKVAHLLLKNKISCVLAASDTFRAASIEQLQVHADKLKIKLIKHDYGADPAAVAFDAIKHAKAHGIEVVLIDTAGRMHTKENLLSEMEKICRVTKPDLKIFVAESIAGNDAVQQAKNFNEIIGIDGSILTKADVDEKGGTAISISYAIQKPIFYLGTGQEYEDLEPFDKEKFVKEMGL